MSVGVGVFHTFWALRTEDTSLATSTRWLSTAAAAVPQRCLRPWRLRIRGSVSAFDRARSFKGRLNRDRELIEIVRFAHNVERL
jgi:hypothetical protein